MEDKNLDANRGKINADLWRRMKAYCILKGIKISDFLESAIKIKLDTESKQNEN